MKIESYDTKSYTPLTQEVIPDPACRAPEAWTSTRVLAFCFHCLLFPFVEIGCVFGLDEVPVREDPSINVSVYCLPLFSPVASRLQNGSSKPQSTGDGSLRSLTWSFGWWVSRVCWTRHWVGVSQRVYTGVRRVALAWVLATSTCPRILTQRSR